MGQGEPPLPTDSLPEPPELDETQLREIGELWDVLDNEEPRPESPVVPGTGLDPQAHRAAQAIGHPTDPSYLPYPPSPDVYPDVYDILNLLNPDEPTTAMHPEPRHLPWQEPGNAAAPTPPSSHTSHAQEPGSVPPPVAGEAPADIDLRQRAEYASSQESRTTDFR